MLTLTLILSWCAGILVNALADSLPLARRVHRPLCPACGGPRPLHAWSGILGMVTGVHACEYCGRKRGWRPAVVEFVSLLAGYWLWQRALTPLSIAIGGLVLALYLLIVVIDIEHRLIPFIVVLPACAVIGLINSLDPARGLLKTLLGGVVGAGLFYLLYLLGGALAAWVGRRRKQPIEEVAFGFGDVMLAGLIGLTVGWPGVIVALFIGILAAGVFSLGVLVVMLARRRYVAFMPIPYGPFLVLGALLVYFGGRTAFERLLAS